MCSIHEPAEANPPKRPRRRRIWEIDSAYHCMVCGSCLGDDDLRKLTAKAGLRLKPDATEFHIHGAVVHAMGKGGTLAKLAQKLLDRKFRAHIRTCAAFSTESELRDWWRRSLERGDIVGPFWALMTHPDTTRALTVELFGEIHMLSHLEGSTNRAFKRRLAAVEREAAAARDRLAERRREIDGLRAELRAAQAENRRLAAAGERLARLESGAERQALAARIAALETAAADREREGRAADERIAEQADRLRARGAENAELRRALAVAESESETLAVLLRRATAGAETAGAGEADDSRPIDLAGRGIVYVGGRASLLGHFRTLVENANGRFFHHDGGVEDSDRLLGRSLAQGDAVLCPVDCVSHGACLRAKKFCKRTSRMFVPLRSSGLSSFVGGLRRVALQ